MFSITTKPALIGINTTNTTMSIRQPKADFELKVRKPELEIHTEQGRIQIDQSQCFNEAGLMDIFTLTEDAAERGRQAAFEAIGRIVDEGNMLASIENGSNAIAEIAYQRSFTEHEFDIGTIPKSRPKIDFIGGNVDIKVHEGDVEILTKPNKPIIDVENGSVEIFLRQKPEINIEYIGSNIDQKV